GDESRVPEDSHGRRGKEGPCSRREDAANEEVPHLQVRGRAELTHRMLTEGEEVTEPSPSPARSDVTSKAPGMDCRRLAERSPGATGIEARNSAPQAWAGMAPSAGLGRSRR